MDLAELGIPKGVIFELKSIILWSLFFVGIFPPWITGECLRIEDFVFIFTVQNRIG